MTLPLWPSGRIPVERGPLCICTQVGITARIAPDTWEKKIVSCKEKNAHCSFKAPARNAGRLHGEQQAERTPRMYHYVQQPYPPAGVPAAPPAPVQPQQAAAPGQPPAPVPAHAPPPTQAYAAPPALSQAPVPHPAPQAYDPSVYYQQPVVNGASVAPAPQTAYATDPYATAATPAVPQAQPAPPAERKRPYDTTGTAPEYREYKRPQVDANSANNAVERETVYRLLVPASSVGAVIGKQGAIVREIRLQTKSRIRVCEGLREWEERVVVISAKDASREDTNQAQCALMEVHKKVLEARKAGKTEGESSQQGDNTFSGFLSTRMLVNRTQAGSIIGKGGSIIKNIRETTGAHVKILPPEDLPQCALDNDRVVQITGNAEQLTAGMTMVARQIRDNPPKERPGGPPAAVTPPQPYYTYPPPQYPPPQYPPMPHVAHPGVAPPAPYYPPSVHSYPPVYPPTAPAQPVQAVKPAAPAPAPAAAPQTAVAPMPYPYAAPQTAQAPQRPPPAQVAAAPVPYSAQVPQAPAQPAAQPTAAYYAQAGYQ